jgi:YHS domain-containing protein
MKNLIAIVVVLALIAGCKETKTSPAPAKSKPAAGITSTVEAAEQTTCPVMGNPIDKQYKTEYKGKTVYFCCPECKPVFDKDPEKYVAKLPQFAKPK